MHTHGHAQENQRQTPTFIILTRFDCQLVYSWGKVAMVTPDVGSGVTMGLAAVYIQLSASFPRVVLPSYHRWFSHIAEV